MGTSDSTSLGSSSESGELVIIEDGWTEYLKDKDSNSAVRVCTETSMPLVDLCELKSSGEDDETVATSSDCTTGSINISFSQAQLDQQEFNAVLPEDSTPTSSENNQTDI